MSSEAQLKRACEDYLQYQENLDNLMWDRLNSGEIIALNRDGSHRRIDLCRPGTADLYVLKHGQLLFLELKVEKGKQSEEQEAFEELARRHGAWYFVIRDVEGLERVLEGV